MEQANRAIPYVRRIVNDIRRVSIQVEIAQDRMQHPLPGDQSNQIRDHYEELLEKLSGYVDELFDVGVDLVDHESGLIDFIAVYNDREICLSWKPDENQIAYWRELDAAIHQRKDIALLQNNQT